MNQTAIFEPVTLCSGQRAVNSGWMRPLGEVNHPMFFAHRAETIRSNRRYFATPSGNGGAWMPSAFCTRCIASTSGWRMPSGGSLSIA